MLPIELNIKPLSVNEAWQGKRYRTEKYNAFITEMLLKLPRITLPNPPFTVTLVFGFSNGLSDLDNPCKLTIDCLQKKYGFNDRHIMQLNISKEITPKGKEFIKFKIEEYGTICTTNTY